MRIFSYFFVVLGCLLIANASMAQDSTRKHKRTGSFYLSWGYNTEWYTKSTIHIKQPGLDNDYQMMDVKAHDHRGWDENFVTTPVTIPQYNYRIGYYFNEKQDLAFVINFDHTKYIITDNQSIRIKGILGGKRVDENIMFSEDNGFYYFLNNGANFFLFNIVKRYPLFHSKNKMFKLDLTPKVGIGPVVPHVENRLFGERNDAAFQFGGWNTGIETAWRATFMKYGFIEFSQKVDYACYSYLRVAQGRANQSFGTFELILSAGFILPTTKHNPEFEVPTIVK